ncbi:N,N'-diacetylchitobiose transport system permease protein [Streptomyces sp. V4I23]|uniref:carbohydrate ABC transporter permease n=1 Tax=Streptomyces sp. V4I23 TaxID=3042282 RepID=UPI00278A6BFC|nr:sugar ABC transporter permease [Streptomyces sp. V4I23]MDQ1008369.1 N,N'-diacetylchitobiose transport system permease protein [Streptomyces sp. V4I23]
MSAADMKAADPVVPVARHPEGPGAQQPKGQAPGPRKAGALLPYLLIGPTILAIAAVFVWPLVKTAVMSFQDVGRKELWTGEPAPWVGFQQFTDIFRDGAFWDSVVLTVVFMAACVVTTLAAGLAISLMMQRMSTWARLLLTAALIAAWSIPLMVAASIFRWFADSDYGVANMVLSKYLGLDFQGHNWFLDHKQGFLVIGAVVVWGAVPFVAITLYAALTQVPRELEEAASIDGVGAFGNFRYVIFPVIKPVFQMVATLSVIWDFNVLGQVWLMRGTKPEPEYEVLGLYAFNKAFESNSFSQGAAISLITVLLLSGVAVYYLRQLLKIGEVE